MKTTLTERVHDAIWRVLKGRHMTAQVLQTASLIAEREARAAGFENLKFTVKEDDGQLLVFFEDDGQEYLRQLIMRTKSAVGSLQFYATSRESEAEICKLTLDMLECMRYMVERGIYGPVHRAIMNQKAEE